MDIIIIIIKMTLSPEQPLTLSSCRPLITVHAAVALGLVSWLAGFTRGRFLTIMGVVDCKLMAV